MGNVKKFMWPLIVILVFLSGYAGFYISTAMAFPQNPSTYEYFTKIADAPYVRQSYTYDLNHYLQHGGDCDDRAYYFHKYLRSKGEKNVYTMSVQRVVNGSVVKPFNDTEGHSFVLWNNRVYDANNNETRRFYDVDLNEYLAYLKNEYGYNTLYFQDGRVASF